MSELYEQLSRQILPLVNRPSRYIGSELGAAIKDHSQVKLSFLLAFPDTYEIGMSHLGLRILYSILNRREDIACERTFAPWVDMEEHMRRSGIPLFSLENHLPACEFDAIGFSLQYELLYTNVINMLDLAGVPARTSDRGESHPYVIGGGSSAFNPEPMADFFDAFAIGEGEKVIVDIGDCLIEAKETELSRKETLRRLASIEGVYIPSLYEAQYDEGILESTEPKEDVAPRIVERRVEEHLESDGLPRDQLVPLGPITHDRLSIEIMRGCTRGCRFQAANLCGCTRGFGARHRFNRL
jgi:radical SAM superfamily enzyme YgiQ (UPF0313 family)